MTSDALGCARVGFDAARRSCAPHEAEEAAALHSVTFTPRAAADTTQAPPTDTRRPHDDVNERTLRKTDSDNGRFDTRRSEPRVATATQC